VREAARAAADRLIWEPASEALEMHVPIGINLSLPNLPELNPIPAGAPGSEWGTGRRAVLRKEKSAVEKRLADLELGRTCSADDRFIAADRIFAPGFGL
jgi:hypothetical protein